MEDQTSAVAHSVKQCSLCSLLTVLLLAKLQLRDCGCSRLGSWKFDEILLISACNLISRGND